MKPGTILLVGATGFVGRAISKRFQRDGWHVRAAARSFHQGPWDEFAQLDISAPPESWPMDGVEVVVLAAGLAHDVHALATSAADHERVNARGAENAAIAARHAGCSRFVLVSSVKAMADTTPSGPLTETDSCNPATHYGRAKLRGEQLASARLEDSSCLLAIVRLTPVYGVGCKGNLDRLLQITSRRWLPLLPTDSGKRSMIHVDDVASLVAAILRINTSGTFIADDGEQYSPRHIQERVRDELDIGTYAIHLPDASFRLAAILASWGSGHAMLRARSDLSRLMDTSLFDGSAGHLKLDWRPEYTLWSELSNILIERQQVVSNF